ncbi:MAG: hypothetical protein QW727_00210 [Candidatus Pacearchaeota archaeon]
MRVIGFTFKKILVEKNKEIINKVNIQTDMKIKDIRKGKSDLFKNNETILVEYDFKIEYQPDFARILFEGGLVFLIDDKNDEDLIKEVLSQWKDKKIHEEFLRITLQLVFNKCSIKALLLEDYLNLPPHLPNPIFTKEDKK